MIKAITLIFAVSLLFAGITADPESSVARNPARELSYTSSTSNSYCKTCINSSATKWCSSTSSTTTGYCCTNSSSNSVCGGSSTYLCSNSSTRFKTNSEYILCPKASSCGSDQDKTLTGPSTVTFTSSTISNTEACWYRVYSTAKSTSVNRVAISILSVSGATPEVYTEDGNYYKYKGTQSSGTKNYSIAYGDSVYVLVRPSSSGYIQFTATGSYSSGNTISLSGGAIAGIVIALIVVLVCVVIILGIVYFIRRKRRQQRLVQNTASLATPVASAEIKSAPQPFVPQGQQPVVYQQPPPLYQAQQPATYPPAQPQYPPHQPMYNAQSPIIAPNQANSAYAQPQQLNETNSQLVYTQPAYNANSIPNLPANQPQPQPQIP